MVCDKLTRQLRAVQVLQAKIEGVAHLSSSPTVSLEDLLFADPHKQEGQSIRLDNQLPP
jgi:hypothetical protein